MFKRLSPSRRKAARRRDEDRRLAREEIRNWSANERAECRTVLGWAVRSVASDRRLLERLHDLFPGSEVIFLRELVDTVAKELGSREAVFAAISNSDRWLSGDPGES